MSIVYGAEESNLNEAILQNFTKSSALAILVFILLYPPCISASAVFKKESDTLSACLSLIINTIIALIVSILVFNIIKF
jgi:ferrous iron transport protein B